MTHAPTRALSAFLETAKRVEGMLVSKAVAARWEDPSALEGYTVSGLAGHLARGVLTVERYVQAPAPPPNAEATDAAGYIATVLGAHDPVDSEFHRTVRARSMEASVGGAAAVAHEVGGARQRLSRRLDDTVMHQRIQVLEGVVVTVEEYLKTRLVELVVHLDDLAVSVGEEDTQGVPEGTYAEVAAVLVQVAVRRHGGLPVIRGLARRERHPAAVRAL